MIIIGADPGKSFGVRSLHINHIPGELLTCATRAFQGEPEQALRFINNLLVDRDTFAVEFDEPIEQTVVIVEAFIVTPGAGRKTGASHTPVLVGQTIELAQRFENVTVVKQTVADASRAFPNAMLRKLGMYVTPRDVSQQDSNDANSATRHCLLYLMRNKATLFEALMNEISNDD